MFLYDLDELKGWCLVIGYWFVDGWFSWLKIMLVNGWFFIMMAKGWDLMVDADADLRLTSLGLIIRMTWALLINGWFIMVESIGANDQELSLLSLKQ